MDRNTPEDIEAQVLGLEDLSNTGFTAADFTKRLDYLLPPQVMSPN